MDAVTIFLTFIFVAYCLSFVLGNKTFTKEQIAMIDAIPGPKRYPFVGTAGEFLFMKRQDYFGYFRKLNQKYGPIFRYWVGSRPSIYLTEPQHVELVLNNTVHIEKGKNYDFVHPWLGEGLLTSTGAQWFKDRKLLTPTFHFKILENFMDVFVEKSQKLVEILSGRSNGQAFDIFPHLTHCTLDIISKSALGIEIDSLSNPENEYDKAVTGLCEIAISRILRPWLGSDFIFYKTKQGKLFLKYLDIVRNTTNNVLDEKRALLREKSLHNNSEADGVGQKKRKAFLDLVMEVCEVGALTNKEICDQVNTFMFAGHDTTASALCWVIFLLAIHPDIQDKCSEEIVNLFPDDRPLVLADLSEFKYLERVIKESQRLFPSVGSITRRANQDIKIENYVIPKGCNINIQIHDLHNNPKYFPKPEKFDPDRFMPENTKDRHPYAYIPFSAGPRNCIGQKFSLAEEKTILIYLLKHFKIKTTQTLENIEPTLEIILRPHKGLFVTLEKR